MSVPAFISPALAGNNTKDNENNTIIVQGVGYPPIKASSMAQAHLMAKRAAIIDAYRNALASAGIENYSENTLYTGLSGFVKGLTILEEEYLEDGGIRILARVPAENIDLSYNTVTKSKKPEETWFGPLRVTLKEWFNIIKKLVKIEK